MNDEELVAFYDQEFSPTFGAFSIRVLKLNFGENPDILTAEEEERVKSNSFDPVEWHRLARTVDVGEVLQVYNKFDRIRGERSAAGLDLDERESRGSRVIAMCHGRLPSVLGLNLPERISAACKEFDASSDIIRRKQIVNLIRQARELNRHYMEDSHYRKKPEFHQSVLPQLTQVEAGIDDALGYMEEKTRTRTGGCASILMCGFAVLAGLITYICL